MYLLTVIFSPPSTIIFMSVVIPILLTYIPIRYIKEESLAEFDGDTGAMVTSKFVATPIWAYLMYLLCNFSFWLCLGDSYLPLHTEIIASGAIFGSIIGFISSFARIIRTYPVHA